MTDLATRVAEVLALVDKATPGKWEPHAAIEYSICLPDGSFLGLTYHSRASDEQERHDRDAIAALHNPFHDHGDALLAAARDGEGWRHHRQCEAIHATGMTPEDWDNRTDAAIQQEAGR